MITTKQVRMVGMDVARLGSLPRTGLISAPDPAESATPAGKRDRSNIAVARFLDHPTPDRAGARPHRVQCRVARCDMGLPAHTSHPLFAFFSRVSGSIP